jgi:hypothetical protein
MRCSPTFYLLRVIRTKEAFTLNLYIRPKALWQANPLAVTVDVDDGVVKLKGTVNSAQKKAQAEEIARKVDGVKSVVNNLEVKP